jgi:hypothetical protein
MLLERQQIPSNRLAIDLGRAGGAYEPVLSDARATAVADDRRA